MTKRTHHRGKPLERIRYEALYAAMIEALPTVSVSAGPNKGAQPFAGVNLGRAQDNLLVALVSAWAEVGDVLSFYNARASAEGYFRTATRPDRVYALSQTVGVAPTPASSATAELAFVVRDPPGQTSPYRLPAGTAVQGVTPTPSTGGAQTPTDRVPAVFETTADHEVDSDWSNARAAFALASPGSLKLDPDTVVVRTTASPAPKKGDLLLLSGSPWQREATLPLVRPVALLTVQSTAPGSLTGSTDLTCAWAPLDKSLLAAGAVADITSPGIATLGAFQDLLGSSARSWAKLNPASRDAVRLPRGGIGYAWLDGSDPAGGRANGGLSGPLAPTGLTVTQGTQVVLATNGSGILLADLDRIANAAKDARDAPSTGPWQPWQSGYYDVVQAPAPSLWTAPKTPPSLKTLLCLAQDVTTFTLYAGAPRGGVYKSDDSGRTWTNLQQGRVLVYPLNGGYQTMQFSVPRSASVWGLAAAQDLVLAATDAGLFATNLSTPQQQGPWWVPIQGSSGMVTWPAIPPPPMPGAAAIPDSLNYIAPTSVAGMFLRNDAGTSTSRFLVPAGQTVYCIDIHYASATLGWGVSGSFEPTSEPIAIAPADTQGTFIVVTETTATLVPSNFPATATTDVSGGLTEFTALTWNGTCAIAAATQGTTPGLFRYDLGTLSWIPVLADPAYEGATLLAGPPSTDTALAWRPWTRDPTPPSDATWPGGIVPIPTESWANREQTPDPPKDALMWTAKAIPGSSAPTLAVLKQAPADPKAVPAPAQDLVALPVTATAPASMDLFDTSATTTRLTVDLTGFPDVSEAYDVSRSAIALGGAPLVLAPVSPSAADLFTGGDLKLAATIRRPPNGRRVYLYGQRARVDGLLDASKLQPSDSNGRIDPNQQPPTAVPTTLFAIRSWDRKEGTTTWLMQEPTGQYYVVEYPTDSPIQLGWPVSTDPTVAVATRVDELEHSDDTATHPPVVDTIRLRAPSTWLYLGGLTCNLNVVPASHGRTLANRVLGSGDSAKASQRFALPVTDLTRISGTSADSTLIVTVSGLVWTEVASLATAGASDTVYALQSTPDGRTTVCFGDGVHGARLPTGRNNVLATFRSGTGPVGNVGPGVLTLLRVKPLFVKSVTNPEAAVGGEVQAPPEQIKTETLVAIGTLDRVVTLKDYQAAAVDDPRVSYAEAVRWTAAQPSGGAAVTVDEPSIGVTIVSTAPNPGPTLGRALVTQVRNALLKRRAPATGTTTTLAVGLVRRQVFQVQTTVVSDDPGVRRAIQAALLDAYGPVRRLGRRPYSADVRGVIAGCSGVLGVLQLQLGLPARDSSGSVSWADELPTLDVDASEVVVEPKDCGFVPAMLFVVNSLVRIEVEGRAGGSDE